jgi:translation initiation factor eIF-2B subunit delta
VTELENKMMLPKDLVNFVKEDRTHGSTELALIAIEGIRKIVEQTKYSNHGELKQCVQSLIVDLQSSRPSMVALNNLLTKIHDTVMTSDATSIDVFQSKIMDSCDIVTRLVHEAQSAVIQNMASLVEANDVIMTHSLSSTVKNLCAFLSESQPSVRLVVTESRPGGEGKLLATYLSELGLTTTYINEAQIDILMPEVSKVVIGADAVLADGSILNKCGTNIMALSARYHSVPFYVCAESFKKKSNNEYELEQLDSDELKFDVAGVEICNVYFEHLPIDLITQWVR